MRKPMVILLGLTLGVAVSGLAAEKEFSGESGGSWFEPGNWSPNGVPSADDNVTIPAGIVVRADGVPTAKSLAIADGAGLSIFGANAVYTESVQFENYSTHTANGYGRIALNATAADAIGLAVVGNVTVSGTGWLAVGGFSQACAASVVIGGNLTLSGAAKMSVYAGPGTPRTVGSTLSVTGSLTVGAGTMLELGNHIGVKAYGVNGTAAHVGITAGAFEVEAGGTVRSVVGCNEYCEATEMGASGKGKDPTFAGSGHGGVGGYGTSASTPGGTLRVFGRSLAPAAERKGAASTWKARVQPGVRVKLGDRELPLARTDVWSLDATVPADLAPGTYAVRVSNGLMKRFSHSYRLKAILLTLCTIELEDLKRKSV